MTDLAYDLDPQTGPRLGLVVLQADETIERDFRRLIPAGTSLLVSRVPSGLEVSRETLHEMEKHIPAAASLFPHDIEFDAVGYGCTSGTAVIGSTRVAELIRDGVDTKSVTEPVTALTAACARLGITRLAFLSPYVEDVSAQIRNLLAEEGIETPIFGTFNVAEEAKVARIAPGSVVEAAASLLASGEAEAIFLSCTNLRTLDVIAEIERISGKPVFSSNQVLAWHMCALAGLSSMPKGYGTLLEEAL